MAKYHGKFGYTLRIGAAQDTLTDDCAGTVVDRAALRKEKRFKALRRAEREVSYWYGAEEPVQEAA